MKKFLLYTLLGVLAINVFIFVGFLTSSNLHHVPPAEPLEGEPDIALLKEHAALKFDEHDKKSKPATPDNSTNFDHSDTESYIPFGQRNGSAKPPLKIMRCYTIGPLSTERDAKKLTEGLHALEMKVKQRIEKPKKFEGYWVYLPPQGSKAAARLKMQEMINKGVKDIAIVYKQSPRYAISLGLFRQKAIAEERLAEIKALGYPAKMVERHNDSEKHWLDIELEESRTLAADRWEKMLAKYAGAKLSETVCD